MSHMMQKAFSILDLFVNSCIVGMHTGPEKIFASVHTHFFLKFNNTQKLFK